MTCQQLSERLANANTLLDTAGRSPESPAIQQSCIGQASAIVGQVLSILQGETTAPNTTDHCTLIARPSTAIELLLLEQLHRHNDNFEALLVMLGSCDPDDLDETSSSDIPGGAS